MNVSKILSSVGSAVLAKDELTKSSPISTDNTPRTTNFEHGQTPQTNTRENSSSITLGSLMGGNEMAI